MLAALIMSRRSRHVRSRQGFTLVELLITVAVMGVLLAVAVPSLSDFLERRRIVAAASEVSDVLHFARGETNSIRDKLTVEIHPDARGIAESDKMSCIAVTTFSGANSCRCYEDPVCPTTELKGSELLRVFQLKKDRGVSFEAFADSWKGAKYQLQVDKGQVMTSVIGFKVVVTGKRTGAKLQIDVNRVGRTRICSPDKSISGYPACA